MIGLEKETKIIYTRPYQNTTFEGTIKDISWPELVNFYLIEETRTGLLQWVRESDVEIDKSYYREYNLDKLQCITNGPQLERTEYVFVQSIQHPEYKRWLTIDSIQLDIEITRENKLKELLNEPT